MIQLRTLGPRLRRPVILLPVLLVLAGIAGPAARADDPPAPPDAPPPAIQPQAPAEGAEGGKSEKPPAAPEDWAPATIVNPARERAPAPAPRVPAPRSQDPRPAPVPAPQAPVRQPLPIETPPVPMPSAEDPESPWLPGGPSSVPLPGGLPGGLPGELPGELPGGGPSGALPMPLPDAPAPETVAPAVEVAPPVRMPLPGDPFPEDLEDIVEAPEPLGPVPLPPADMDAMDQDSALPTTVVETAPVPSAPRRRVVRTPAVGSMGPIVRSSRRPGPPRWDSSRDVKIRIGPDGQREVVPATDRSPTCAPPAGVRPAAPRATSEPPRATPEPWLPGGDVSPLTPGPGPDIASPVEAGGFPTQPGGLPPMPPPDMESGGRAESAPGSRAPEGGGFPPSTPPVETAPLVPTQLPPATVPGDDGWVPGGQGVPPPPPAPGVDRERPRPTPDTSVPPDRSVPPAGTGTSPWMPGGSSAPALPPPPPTTSPGAAEEPYTPSPTTGPSDPWSSPTGSGGRTPVPSPSRPSPGQPSPNQPVPPGPDVGVPAPAVPVDPPGTGEMRFPQPRDASAAEHARKLHAKPGDPRVTGYPRSIVPHADASVALEPGRRPVLLLFYDDASRASDLQAAEFLPLAVKYSDRIDVIPIDVNASSSWSEAERKLVRTYYMAVVPTTVVLDADRRPLLLKFQRIAGATLDATLQRATADR